MKQHITLDQLEQLSETEQAILRKQWRVSYGQLAVYRQHIFVVKEYDEKTNTIRDLQDHIEYSEVMRTNLYPKSECLPLLDIGQMIELLYNHHTCIQLEIGTKGFYSEIKAGVKNKQGAEEVCDALWDGTVHLLKTLRVLEQKGEK